MSAEPQADMTSSDLARMIEQQLYKLIELSDQHEELNLLSVLLSNAALEAQDQSKAD